MGNPFEELHEKLDVVIKRLDSIESIKKVPTKIPLSTFCKEQNITRPTAYAWSERGLIRMEKTGGRQYIASDSIIIDSKYQRSTK